MHIFILQSCKNVCMVKMQIHRHKTKSFNMPIISQLIQDGKAAGTIPGKVLIIPKSEQLSNTLWNPQKISSKNPKNRKWKCQIDYTMCTEKYSALILELWKFLFFLPFLIHLVQLLHGLFISFLLFLGQFLSLIVITCWSSHMFTLLSCFHLFFDCVSDNLLSEHQTLIHPVFVQQ